MPDPVIVFERGGHVYVYRDAIEAGASIEAMDVEEGFYTDAYSVTGERLKMIPHGLEVEFAPTGEFRWQDLSESLAASAHPEGASDPARWALDELARE